MAFGEQYPFNGLEFKLLKADCKGLVCSSKLFGCCPGLGILSGFLANVQVCGRQSDASHNGVSTSKH